MKRLIIISLFFAIPVIGISQINPTTHLKPGTDSTQILLTKKASPYRFVYRDLYSYLADTLGFGLTIVDSTRLTTDSILIYYNSGSEVGRDTIRTAGGSTTSPAGSDSWVQYNDGGSFGAESDLRYNDVLNQFFGGNYIYAVNWYGFTNDADTYITNVTADAIRFNVGNAQFIDLTESTTDDIDLGTGIRLDMRNANPIVDDNGSTGVTGQFLSRAASGGVDWVDPPSAGSPGGSSGDVQYNDGASGFAGESTFNYNSTTNLLTIEDLYVTTGLYDGANSDGTNYELLTSTGTESRWKTISNSITGRYLYIDLDGTTIGAGVDLSDANLSDAGKVFNNSVAQNFYQVSPTKITNWGTTASFSGTGINWDSTNDEWDLTANGKYRVKCMINIDGTAEATATAIRFEIRIDSGSGDTKQGIYYHYYADPDRNITCSIDEVFNLSSGDSITIYVQRGDAGTGKTVTMSTTNESYFMVERINY